MSTIEIVRPLDFARVLAVDEDSFSATLHDFGDGRGFGGDSLGRALPAARRTTDPTRRLCSFHALFLRPGPVGEPLPIDIERTNGGRISQRRARLRLADKSICELVATFAVASAGPSYQEPSAPEVPGPDGLPSDVEVARAEGMEWQPGEVEWRWVERDGAPRFVSMAGLGAAPPADAGRPGAARGGARTRRQIFDAQGRLLATGTQEGLHPSAG